MFANVGADAFALGADDEGKGEWDVGGEDVECVVAGVEGGGPPTRFFEGADGTGQVGDAGDAEVFDGAGGSVDDGRSDIDGAIAGDEDAGNANGLGGAEERAEVLWVLEVVEDKDRSRMLDNVFESRIDIHCSFEGDTLVIRAHGSLVEKDAGHDFDRQGETAGGFEETTGAVVFLDAFSEHERAMTATARQSFADRIASVEEITVRPGRFRAKWQSFRSG